MFRREFDVFLSHHCPLRLGVWRSIFHDTRRRGLRDCRLFSQGFLKVVKSKRERATSTLSPEMTKQRKNVGVTAKVMEPLLTVPEPRVSQRTASLSAVPAQSKYIKLLRVIEQLGRDLKICYTGDNIHKTLVKVERDIAKACSLVQQCRAEAVKSARKTCQ